MNVDGNNVPLLADPPASFPSVEATNLQALQSGNVAALQYDRWTAVLPGEAGQNHAMSVTVSDNGTQYSNLANWQAAPVVLPAIVAQQSAASPREIRYAGVVLPPPTPTPSPTATPSITPTPAPTVGPYNGFVGDAFSSHPIDLTIDQDELDPGGTITATVDFHFDEMEAFGAGGGLFASYADPTTIVVDGTPIPAPTNQQLDGWTIDPIMSPAYAYRGGIGGGWLQQGGVSEGSDFFANFFTGLQPALQTPSVYVNPPGAGIGFIDPTSGLMVNGVSVGYTSTHHVVQFKLLQGYQNEYYQSLSNSNGTTSWEGPAVVAYSMGDTASGLGWYYSTRGFIIRPQLHALRIDDLQATPDQLDPEQGQSSTSISATIVPLDFSPTNLQWTLQIQDLTGAPVQTFSGSGTQVSATWDTSAQPAPAAGQYQYVLQATCDEAITGTASNFLTIVPVTPVVTYMETQNPIAFTDNNDNPIPAVMYDQGTDASNPAIASFNSGGQTTNAASGNQSRNAPRNAPSTSPPNGLFALTLRFAFPSNVSPNVKQFDAYAYTPDGDLLTNPTTPLLLDFTPPGDGSGILPQISVSYVFGMPPYVQKVTQIDWFILPHGQTSIGQRQFRQQDLQTPIYVIAGRAPIAPATNPTEDALDRATLLAKGATELDNVRKLLVPAVRQYLHDGLFGYTFNSGHSTRTNGLFGAQNVYFGSLVEVFPYTDFVSHYGHSGFTGDCEDVSNFDATMCAVLGVDNGLLSIGDTHSGSFHFATNPATAVGLMASFQGQILGVLQTPSGPVAVPQPSEEWSFASHQVDLFSGLVADPTLLFAQGGLINYNETVPQYLELLVLPQYLPQPTETPALDVQF